MTEPVIHEWERNYMEGAHRISETLRGRRVVGYVDEDPNDLKIRFNPRVSAEEVFERLREKDIIENEGLMGKRLEDGSLFGYTEGRGLQYSSNDDISNLQEVLESGLDLNGQDRQVSHFIDTLSSEYDWINN